MVYGPQAPLPSDEGNPYAPPRSPTGKTPYTRLRGMVPFELDALLRATWTIYTNRLGACISVCWTVMALISGAQFLQSQLMQMTARAPGDRFMNFLVPFGLFFGGYVLSVWLSIGQSLALLGLARGEHSVFDRIFQGGRYLLTTILAGLVFLAIIALTLLLYLIWIPILARILGGWHGPVLVLLVIGGAGGIVTALILAARFSQFGYFILDMNTGVIQSLQASREVTRGHIVTLIFVYGAICLINLGGLLACFVGLLFITPFTGLVLAVVYLSLTGQPVGEGSFTYGDWDVPEDPDPRSWNKNEE
ncbi:MAG: hypothetical protein JO161_04565 [Planctomycetaceae bacterium]|nr:hypothetical protein [Planctomycetaceae bacterium]